MCAIAIEDTTIVGLKQETVELLREWFETHQQTVPTVQQLRGDSDLFDCVEQWHLDQFAQQIEDGDRCGGCGRHWYQVVLPPGKGPSLCADVCLMD